MKTVYANTSRPTLAKWSCGIAFAVGLTVFILYLTLDGEDRYMLNLVGFCLMYAAMFTAQYYLRGYEIDPENDTLTDLQNKKYPIHISNLTTATYKKRAKKANTAHCSFTMRVSASWISESPKPRPIKWLNSS